MSEIFAEQLQAGALLEALKQLEHAVIIRRLDGIVIFLNRAAEELFGYSAEEMIGQSIALVVPADHEYELELTNERLRRGGRLAASDSVRRHRDGRLIDVSLSVTPLFDETGDVFAAMTVVSDVTPHKQLNERLWLAFESSPSGMIMVDSNGKIMMANAETVRMFGYSLSELLGQSVEVLVPEDKRDDHRDHRADFTQSPEARRMGAGRELYGRRKDGSQFPLEIGLKPIRTREGLLILSVVVDITDRLNSTLALAQQTEELRRSNADLEQFAYVASHDLQEPLRMVSSYVELLAQRYEGQLDEKADKYIGYAVEGAKRMKLLVSDLLAYSRVGTQGRALHPVEANEIARSVLFELRQTINAAGATVKVDELPVVMADETQLRQLLHNLIGNGIKFRAERPPVISVSARRLDTDWIFRISDNGIGIDEAYRERIFQMFQRLHERGRYEGSGIGLALAKRIVERHGGRIWFDSVPGEGSDFYFTMRPAEGGSS